MSGNVKFAGIGGRSGKSGNFGKAGNVKEGQPRVVGKTLAASAWKKEVKLGSVTV